MKTVGIIFVLIITAAALFAGGGQEEAVKAEGSDTFTIGKMGVSCSASDGMLEVTVEAPTTGWVAIGFNPSSMMKDANIIIGYVDGNSAVVQDHFGVSGFGHKEDTGLGGSDDIKNVSGNESDDGTTLSFSIPLDSGDKYDTPLQAGDEVKVILAYGDSDNLSAKHTYRTSASITIQ